ncbi:MAG: glycosyltransferase family 1 protein [Bacteroidota bacterium]
MRVLYDFQIFEEQRVGGVSRYFFELMREFQRMSSPRVLFPLMISDNYYLQKGKNLKGTVSRLLQREFRGKYRLRNWLKNYSSQQLERIVRQQAYDLFHPTYYQPLENNDNRPYVITVHDMIHELFAHQYEELNGSAFMQQKKEIILNAARIIAISQQTKSDLIRLYGAGIREKIDVVYHGNSLRPLRSKSTQSPVETAYLLFVGGRNAYKNFDRFFQAIAPLLHPELQLVCVGAPFNESEKEMIRRHGATELVRAVRVSDEGLVDLYQHAMLFVFPSLYEGFGFPMLEAFSCGCPVAASNSSSLPEVGGEAAIYFDPNDDESIRSCIAGLIEDPQLRQRMKEKGLQREREFSWSRCAAETHKSYQKALR